MRAAGAEPEPPARPMPDPADFSRRALKLSGDLAFVKTPCLSGTRVRMESAVRHPSLEGPIGYLQGRALVPLLQRLSPGQTAFDLARGWAAEMPLGTGIAIAGWLVQHGLLVEAQP
jgi:hypothetical protein